MSRFLRCVAACALFVVLQSCSSGPGGVGALEGFSGGVPITARTLTSVKPDPKPVEVSVTWPVAPLSATATFRYYVLDYSSSASPAWVLQSDALVALAGDADGDWDVDVPVSGATTTHTVLIKPGIAKTYRVVVLVSMIDGATEYAGSAWFEAKP